MKVSSVSGVTRTADDVKKKWRYVSSDSKKKLSHARKQASKTGGGSSSAMELSATELRELETMEQTATEEIPGGLIDCILDHQESAKEATSKTTRKKKRSSGNEEAHDLVEKKRLELEERRLEQRRYDVEVERHSRGFMLPVEFSEHNRANLTTPTGFCIKTSSIPNAGLGAWTETEIPIYKVIGIYEGEEFFDDNDQDHLYAWILNSGDEGAVTHFVDAASPAKSNWLRYINSPRNYKEENVHSVICDDLVFYMTSQVVTPNTELLVWYGSWYGFRLGIKSVHPEDDLDLDNAFYVRVSYLNQDYPGKFRFHDNTTVR
ncbi:histone-lysine N-methyltransferase PRDM7-like [Saccostrea cucullata]|uniref:histone-lysine N-methyltransferase PRDM7-like n=1 Tax=Saccostrea cuccullata TaxID=36930 RepID=UPI002ED1341C